MGMTHCESDAAALSFLSSGRLSVDAGSFFLTVLTDCIQIIYIEYNL